MFDALSAHQSVEQREVDGGTGPSAVRAQLEAAQKALERRSPVRCKRSLDNEKRRTANRGAPFSFVDAVAKRLEHHAEDDRRELHVDVRHRVVSRFGVDGEAAQREANAAAEIPADVRLRCRCRRRIGLARAVEADAADRVRNELASLGPVEKS